MRSHMSESSHENPHQPRPAGPVVMRQRWRDLLFLHWTLPVDVIAKTLPPGLTVDVWQDRAWVGIVPFFMEGVRPSYLPAVPWLSSFLELNVRTYVRDEQGRPGVWFYSLDCNRWPAVRLARGAFHLAYRHADMHAERGEDGTVSYQCRRLEGGRHKEAYYQYRGVGETRMAQPGTTEFFLLERYRLFSWNAARRSLHTGEVWHEPYPFREAAVEEWSAGPSVWNGGFALEGPPVTSHFSAGVDVRVFPLGRV